MIPRTVFYTLIWLVAGFVIWSFALVALYALHGVSCARGWVNGEPETWLRLALILAWLTHAAAGAWLLYATLRRRWPGEPETGRFLRGAAAGVAGAGLGATLWFGAPILLLRFCV